MIKPTQPLYERIAVVFDFDETLVRDTFDVLLENFNLDVKEFRQQRVKPLIDSGWDKVLARAHCLIEESKQRETKDKITAQRLAQIGKELEPFSGVEEMFTRLRKRACEVVPEVEIEFYLITGGFLDIARNTSIAPNFKGMWGCEFHYASDGEIQFLKTQMTHTEKTRYLFYISKGIDKANSKDLIFSYSSIPDEELHVPLNQMIYVGDGTSDIPCFSILNKYQGIPIGLYKDGTQEWEHQAEISNNQQVINLAPADYSENSELMRSLFLAIESICKQIALHQLSVKK
ncbi:HAD hydrolase-like protein [Mastigocoleus testarum]|uniref:Phosphatase n=1 Tax=Mastigocoleus testarum BC008 TaxID=371196 RepID=A0A0V7ZDD8_9CYAN|nr:HAD family hydrolase [Mastigocoleus testarum]KST62487.1 phosphatase [Mastigocoleus testarum BC008]